MAEHVSCEALQTITVVSRRMLAWIWLVRFQCFFPSTVVECANSLSSRHTARRWVEFAVVVLMMCAAGAHLVVSL